MKIEISGNACTVTREENDPKFYGVQNAAGESRLLYAIKEQLNKAGTHGRLIKKKMWKDGHMVSDYQQYIRSANPNKPGAFCIFNPSFAIAGAEEDFNKGQVILTVFRFDG